MQVSFSIKNVNEIFDEWKQQIDKSIIISNKSDKILKYPPKLANGLIRDISLDSGVKIFIQKVVFPQPITLELESGDTSLLKLCFCVSGSARCRGLIGSKEEEVNIFDKQCSLSFLSDYQGSIDFYAGKENTLISISIDPKKLDYLIADNFEQIPVSLQQIIQGKQNSFLLKNYRMTPEIHLAVEQVLNCPYQGIVKKLYLESKANELIALTLQQIIDVSKSNQTKVLGKGDIDRIHQAKDILINHFHNPPSLINLARLVGLNDYKLKIGFRQVFGTTAFGYLRELRMQQARQLLETGLNVTEVARTVGYASETSFSTAFRKKFGVTPIVYKSGYR